MEANDNFKYCMSLNNGSKLSKSNIFDFESHFRKECPVKVSMDSSSNGKSIEICNNEIRHIQIPSEVFKSNCSSEISTKLLRRVSLLNQFDPLHSKHQTTKVKNDSCNTYDIRERTKISSEVCGKAFPKEILNKTISKNYVGDTLVSQESPMKTARHVFPKVLFSGNTRPVKKYSQEEFQQALKVQELNLQRKFSQELLKYEKACAAKNQEHHKELSELTSLKRSYSAILSQVADTFESIRTSYEEKQAKFEDLWISNEQLKTDIFLAKEYSCKVKSALSDLYKRYETAESMIKNYEENEKHLLKNIESMQLALGEQEIKNDLLNSRIQELKAAKDCTKKSIDTQVMILEAKLKKCEIKIFSLENDLKQAKSDSDKFGRIHEHLMENFRT